MSLTDEEIAENFRTLTEKIELDIAGPKHCSLMSVFHPLAGDDEDANFVPFTYTIGLTDMGWPELIIAGLQSITAGRLLNDLVKKCMDDLGPPVAGLEVHKVANFPLRFQTISDAQRDQYLAWAVGRQERVGGPEPQVLQVIYPDINGKWPDDPQCEAKTAFLQQLPTDEQMERVQ